LSFNILQELHPGPESRIGAVPGFIKSEFERFSDTYTFRDSVVGLVCEYSGKRVSEGFHTVQYSNFIDFSESGNLRDHSIGNPSSIGAQGGSGTTEHYTLSNGFEDLISFIPISTVHNISESPEAHDPWISVQASGNSSGLSTVHNFSESLDAHDPQISVRVSGNPITIPIDPLKFSERARVSNLIWDCSRHVNSYIGGPRRSGRLLPNQSPIG
jgi:hypothetical protein